MLSGLRGCVAELLITLDPVNKTRALDDEISSVAQLLPSVHRSATAAAELLGTTLRKVYLDYSSKAFVSEVIVKGLGVPRRISKSMIPYLWKNSPVYIYMAHLSKTDLLLHFDSDVVIHPSPLGASRWLVAAAEYLQNSTALKGLWSVGLEACSPYIPGTVDLTLPVLPLGDGGNMREFDAFPGRCEQLKAGFSYVELLMMDRIACKETCRHAWMRCQGYEWHSKGGRCLHWVDGEGSALTVSESGVTCHVRRSRHRDPRQPERPRGRIYMRMQRYQHRGPLANLRSLMIRLSRFKLMWPLMHLPSNTNISSPGLWPLKLNIDTVLELRMLSPYHDPLKNVQPISAFLGPEHVGGACIDHGVAWRSAERTWMLWQTRTCRPCRLARHLSLQHLLQPPEFNQPE